MTRFFLTTEQMADLVFGALRHTEGGEVFLYQMSAVRIEDLAAIMIDKLAPAYGFEPEAIDIEIIGRRMGETLHEEIMTEREADRALSNQRLYAVPPETGESNGYLSHDGIEGFNDADTLVRCSADAELLDREEVSTLLDEAGVLEVPA